MAKEFFTSDGVRVIKKDGDFYVRERKIEPRQLYKYMKWTGTQLHETRECKDNFIYTQRKLDEDFIRKLEENKF